MKHGFIKVAAATAQIKVADTKYNTDSLVALCTKASAEAAEIIVLPELCITGYTCNDLFFHSTLLKGALDSLASICKQTQHIDALIFIGMPLMHGSKLYNCAVAIQKGEVLAAVPKTFIPNYSEFYEMRHFAQAPDKLSTIQINGNSVPFGTDILFNALNMPELCIAAEICEDVWAPNPPSTRHALAGANLIVNLSASDEIIGKAEYRRNLICNQSARLLCGYVYSSAGFGESTSDMVFAGHNLICENGSLLAQSNLFENDIIISEIDIDKLVNERIRNTSFRLQDDSDYITIPFTVDTKNTKLTRYYSPSPFVPSDKSLRDERCNEILTMQASGLAKRLAHTHSKTAVVGISGGLDSCLALLVMASAFKMLNRPLSDIVAVTMPCFGTTERTRSNAQKLCDELGVTLEEINITDTVLSNFKDINHDENTHDVTFENVQARVRTLVLMNLANKTGGLVVGTGDLSELALGWATYNGDHMSMYGVNCSIPKTLVRHLVAFSADITHNPSLAIVLQDILDTPVSPELLPAKDGEISQQTEEIVGPYELHDFFLYYLLRFTFSPKKIFFLAKYAFNGKYTDKIILKWLKIFCTRFFMQQFKRNCIPDGPKVGSVTLSPRGDLRMPSDAMSTLWLQEIEELNNEL